MGNKLKEMPKKGTIIKNLTERVDNMSLAVKSLDNGIRIYWETTSRQHLKANKEVLDLLSKEELYEFVDNICHSIDKKFTIGMFRLESYRPSAKVERPSKKEAKINDLHFGKKHNY